MGAVEVSKLQSMKEQGLWNGLHVGNATFCSNYKYLMSSVSYLNMCVFNRELSECMCFVYVFGTCSYIRSGAQNNNMWEQNEEKNMCDRQIHVLRCFDGLIHDDNMLHFGRKIQK